MNMLRRVNSCLLIVAIFLSVFAGCPGLVMREVSATDAAQVSGGTELIDLHTQWRYLDNGTDPAAGNARTSWTTVEFDDSAWKTNGSKTAQFGSKRGQLTDLGGGYVPVVLLNHYLSDGTTGVPTYFFRTTFQLEGDVTGLLLSGTLAYDDAVIVYVNGQKVISYHEPDGGFASNLSYGGSNETAPLQQTFTVDASCLKQGTNIVAIEVHNGKSTSSDVYFEMSSLSLVQPDLMDITHQWRYLDDGTDPAGKGERTSWTTADYDDSHWKTNAGKAAKFGSLTNELQALSDDAIPEVKLQQYLEGTTINTPSFFFRTTFELNAKPEGQMLTGTIKYDDAVIIYINGKKVTSLGEPEGGFETNLSYGGANEIDPISAIFRVDTSCLVEGTNVIAVELHQGRASSPDVYFELSSLNFTRTQQKNFSLTVGADETQRNLCWYVNSDVAGVVHYAVKTNEDFPQQYSVAQASSVEASNYVGFYSNKATMTDLLPNTTYVYRLVNGSTISETFTFTTADEEDFSFLFVGDPQIGTSDVTSDAKAWENSLNIALNAFPETDFLISAGDQVNSPENEVEYTAYLSVEGLASLTTATLIGNHDNGSVAYSEHFNNPNTKNDNGTSYGATPAGCDYWYRFNNTLFIHLNTNNQSYAEHKIFMQNAVAKNPDAVWKVVVFHHSIYSAAGHIMNEDSINRREQLVPIFQELDIDVVLMGHDHVYVRTYMMDGLEPDISNGIQSKVENPSGILYVTGNSVSGSKYYDVLENYDFSYAAVIQQEYTTSFSNVTITDYAFTITTYRTEDLSVIDQFEIVKTGKATRALPKSGAASYIRSASDTDAQLQAVKTDAIVTLDGNIVEFADAPAYTLSNAQLRAMWDGTYLYLAVEHSADVNDLSLQINQSKVTAAWSGKNVTGSSGVTGFAQSKVVELRIYLPALGVLIKDYGEVYPISVTVGSSSTQTSVKFTAGENRSTIPFTASTAAKYVVGFAQNGSTFTLNSSNFSGEAYIRTGWHTNYYNALGTTANYRSQTLSFNHTIKISKLPEVRFSNVTDKILADEQGIVLYLHDQRAANTETGAARDEDCILASIYREDDAEGRQNLYLYIHSDVNGGKRTIMPLGKTVGTEFALGLVWTIDNRISVYVDGSLIGSSTGIDSGYVGFSSTDIGGLWVKNVQGTVDVTVSDASLQTISATSLQEEIQVLKDAGTLTTSSLIGAAIVTGNLPATYYGVHIPISWSVIDGIVSSNGQVIQPDQDVIVTLQATIAGISLNPATVTIAGKLKSYDVNPGDWTQLAVFDSSTFNRSATKNFAVSGGAFCFDNETLLDSATTVTNGDIMNAFTCSAGIKDALDHNAYDIMLEQTLRIDALPVKGVNDHGVFYGDQLTARGYSFYMSDRVAGTNGQDNIMLCTIQNEGDGKLSLYIVNEKRYSAYGSTAIDLGRSLGEEFKLTTVWNKDNSVDVYVDGAYVESVQSGTRTLYYVGNDSVGFRFANLDGYAKITVTDVKLSADDLAASTGGIWYTSVSSALNSANSGAEVLLRKDAYLDQLTIPDDVTLNLDGKKIHLVSGLTSFGQIIDAKGTGRLTLSQNAQLLLTNRDCDYLPILDGAEDNWRFLRYELVSLGVKDRSGALHFGFTIRFEDPNAYRLLGSEDQGGVGFALKLSWSENEDGKLYAFNPALIQEFADLTVSMLDRGLPGEAALMLTVTGADTLPEGSYVRVEPVLTSTAGCEIWGEALQYS